MSQHDFVIDNGPGLAVRTDINAALLALVQQNSGPVEPTTKYPGQLWLDTSVAPNGQLRQRNQANTAWVIVALGDFVKKAGDTMTGSLSVNGSISAIGNRVTTDSNFASTTATAILATTGAGSIYLRPNGAGSISGQATVDSTGMILGTFSATGASDGKSIGGAFLQSSRNITTGTGHLNFYNPNGLVGAITTSGSATAYGTSSDENLKDFIGLYDPLKAIDIIRRDPVRDFNWKVDGSYAVGWGAQTSYAISHDLAQPPEDVPLEEGKTAPAPGEAGYQPWGMDQSKRTPYLWAALAWAVDRIDDLEARLSALEAAAA